MQNQRIWKYAFNFLFVLGNVTEIHKIIALMNAIQHKLAMVKKCFKTDQKKNKLNKKPSCVEQIVEVISTIVDDSNKI